MVNADKILNQGLKTISLFTSGFHQIQFLSLRHHKKNKNMKKLKFIIPLLIGGSIFLAACSQGLDNSKVPTAVRDSFAKDFSGNSPKWDKENSNYEANFKTDGKTMSALYDENGNKQETETDINISNLPAAVTDYVSQNYKGEKIKEAAIITKANGEVKYEAEVNGKDLLFRKDGKFIKEAKD